jgi:hypothetical protein
VPGDANGENDVFVFDQVTGSIELISATPNGSAGNAWSAYPSISADGRLVAFESHADNLVPASPNPKTDVFVFDRATHSMKRLNIDPAGQQTNLFLPAITPDGRRVGFRSTLRSLFPPGSENLYQGLFVYDLATGQINLIGPSAGEFDGFAISADSRFAALSEYGVSGWVNVLDSLTHQVWSASTNVAGIPGGYIIPYVDLSPNAALTVFYSFGMRLPPDPQILCGAFAWRGTGSTLHLDVQVDLSWATIYLPSIKR